MFYHHITTKHHKAGNAYSEFQEEKMDWDYWRE